MKKPSVDSRLAFSLFLYRMRLYHPLVWVTNKSGGCYGIHRSSMDDCCVAIISLSPIPLSCQSHCHPYRRNDTQDRQASGRQ